MPPTEFHIARREEGRVSVREGALRVRWRMDDLASADGHQIICAFAASVRAIDEAVERRMLEETFLVSSDGLTVDDLRAHFEPALRTAADQMIRAMEGNQCIMDEARNRLSSALAAAGSSVAFSCGIEMLAPYEVQIESPTLSRQRSEQRQRQWAQERAAEQLQQLQRSAALLDQFRASQKTHPELSASAVLSRVASADRGEMLQSLLAAAASQSPAQLPIVVAGNALVRVSVNGSGVTAKSETIRTELGPLRSVQSGEIGGQRVLLVGARGGVIVLPAPSPSPGTPGEGRGEGSPTPATDYGITTDSLLGFSQIVIWRDMIWACHGEAGVVGWAIDQPAEPAVVVRESARSARHLTVLDDQRLLVSCGESLVVIDPRGSATVLAGEGTSPILAILPAGGRIATIHENGQIVVRDIKSLEVLDTHHRGIALCAAAAIPWLGEQRLLLAPQSGPIQCIGLDDPLVTQYASVHQGVRMLAASTQYVAAVSADRQRLILWNIWDGKKPLGELHVTSITRHRIADVDLS